MTPFFLEVLVRFLRHDFDAIDEESLHQRTFLDVMWPVDIDEAKELQRELTDDLAPVIIPKRHKRGKGRFEHQDSVLNTAAATALVEKINTMNLAPLWAIQWVNPRRIASQFETNERFFNIRKKAKREAYANFLKSEGKRFTPKAIREEMKRTPIPMGGRLSDMPPIVQFYAEALEKYKVTRPPVIKYPEPVFPDSGQGLVRLGQQKFYVSKLFYTGSPKQCLYGLVIEALERGDLSRLRRCTECHRFFVANDLRQKFCTEDCRDRADRRDARRRVRAMRKRRRNLRIASAPQPTVAPEFSPPASFINFFRRVTGSLPSGEQEKLTPWVKAIGQGRALDGWAVIRKWKGKNPEEVWPTLPNEVRETLQALPL